MTDRAANVAELRRLSKMLVDWLNANMPFDDALPVLVMTAGTVLQQQCAHAPANVRQAHLMEGIEIAHAMMVAAALFEKEGRNDPAGNP